MYRVWTRTSMVAPTAMPAIPIMEAAAPTAAAADKCVPAAVMTLSMPTAVLEVCE